MIKTQRSKAVEHSEIAPTCMLGWERWGEGKVYIKRFSRVCTGWAGPGQNVCYLCDWGFKDCGCRCCCVSPYQLTGADLHGGSL